MRVSLPVLQHLASCVDPDETLSTAASHLSQHVLHGYQSFQIVVSGAELLYQSGYAKMLYEPWHGLSNNMVCSTSKASDQPAHTRSLIRAFARLLTEHHLEFLSLKEGCTCSSESIHVKMPHCWNSHVTAHNFYACIHSNREDPL